MAPPMIAGLYPYRRGGVTSPPVVTLREIPTCLEVNPWYREDLIVLAGDQESREHLEGFFDFDLGHLLNPSPLQEDRKRADVVSSKDDINPG